MKQSLLDTVLNGENFLEILNIKDLDLRPIVDMELALCVPLYQTHQMEAESFEKARTHAWNYLQSVYVILNVNPALHDPSERRWVTPEERAIILHTLGPPPPFCYPIYFISVGDARDEKLVYIGKMSSPTPRFRNGHPAITKLHAPQYESKTKRLYMCTVIFRAEDFSVSPIEFLRPTSHADAVLASLEAQLIHYFEPELNSMHISTENTKWPLSVMFRNSAGTNFMDGAMCHHMSLPLL
jgi:hypothetical protein